MFVRVCACVRRCVGVVGVYRLTTPWCVDVFINLELKM